MRVTTMTSDSALQDKVDSMLRRGVVFSILWLMGIGSAISIVQAIRAKKIVDASNGEVTGGGNIWWCFIVGGLGVLFWGFVVVMVIVNATKS
jgi:hypothetical protein